MRTLKFEGLDDDVIQCIANILPPPDVISFALTSKRLHFLSAARLKTHRTYQSNFSQLTITNDWYDYPDNSFSVPTPLAALHMLSVDPWKAYYVQRLTYDNGEDHANHDEPDIFEIWEWLLQGKPDCITKADFLTTQQQQEWYCELMYATEGIVCDGEDWEMDDDLCVCGKTFVLLLNSLPNLKFFNMRGDPTWHSETGYLVHFAEEKQKSPTNDSLAPLSKLRTIHLDGSSTVIPIMSLVGLPSVRQFFIEGVNEWNPHNAAMAIHVLDHYPPDLKVFGLAGSMIVPGFVEAVVAKSPELQRLTVTMDAEMDFPCGENVWDMNINQFIGHTVGSAIALRRKGFTMHHAGPEEDDTRDALDREDVKEGAEDEDESDDEEAKKEVELEEHGYCRTLDFKLEPW